MLAAHEYRDALLMLEKLETCGRPSRAIGAYACLPGVISLAGCS